MSGEEKKEGNVLNSMAWRRDAEARVRTGRSKSQELRFALAELFNVMTNPHLVKATFEEFYENRMNLSIENVLDEAESCVFVTDVVEENAKLEGYTLIQEKKTEAPLVSVDYGKEESAVVQWWKRNKDGSATLLGEEKIESGQKRASFYLQRVPPGTEPIQKSVDYGKEEEGVIQWWKNRG